MNSETPGDESCSSPRQQSIRAEFLENLLQAEGVPTLVCRAADSTCPTSSPGPREVLVPASWKGWPVTCCCRTNPTRRTAPRSGDGLRLLLRIEPRLLDAGDLVRFACSRVSLQQGVRQGIEPGSPRRSRSMTSASACSTIRRVSSSTSFWVLGRWSHRSGRSAPSARPSVTASGPIASAIPQRPVPRDLGQVLDVGLGAGRHSS